ncbi:hypothetical protein [Enterococcus sp. DIV0802c]|uniref:hypothetical protein n=1 Tax=Enterococcus sp. DIV0802c TaxID=2774743 RepID=UPI003F6828E7
MKKLLEFERVQRIIIELKKNMIKTAIPVENLVFHSETGTKEFERGAYFGEKISTIQLQENSVYQMNFKIKQSI